MGSETMPERIWALDDAGSGYGHGGWRTEPYTHLPPTLYVRADLHEAAEAELARLREAVLVILDSDGGFVVSTAWSETGHWSKHDRCAHGRWRYEGCEVCMETAIRAALATPAREGGEKP